MALEVFEERNESNFSGSIIHIDTVGNIRNEFTNSRRYSELSPFIVGLIDRNKLKIMYALDKPSISLFRGRVIALINEFQKPYFAFNATVVQAVLYHFTGQKIDIAGELNRKAFESRLFAIHALNIPQYGDPFSDQDKLCTQAWLKGEIEKCVAHVRACLLKERDIFIKRGFRKPEEIKLRR
ncbi:MAG: hypothetical protein QXL78_00510 [Methanocellales archaeon]